MLLSHNEINQSQKRKPQWERRSGFFAEQVGSPAANVFQQISGKYTRQWHQIFHITVNLGDCWKWRRNVGLFCMQKRGSDLPGWTNVFCWISSVLAAPTGNGSRGSWATVLTHLPPEYLCWRLNLGTFVMQNRCCTPALWVLAKQLSNALSS